MTSTLWPWAHLTSDWVWPRALTLRDLGLAPPVDAVCFHFFWKLIFDQDAIWVVMVMSTDVPTYDSLTATVTWSGARCTSTAHTAWFVMTSVAMVSRTVWRMLLVSPADCNWQGEQPPLASIYLSIIHLHTISSTNWTRSWASKFLTGEDPN